MFRTLPALVISLVMLTAATVAPAQAQELLAANAMANTVLFPVTPLVPTPVAIAAAEAAEAAQQAPLTRETFPAARADRRPLILPALYAAQAALQVMDAHSTYAALGRGGVEANPLMQGVVKNKGAMMAVKAGVAASTIWVAERMWKKGNRAGAIATMLVVNGITAAVVANNYTVASRPR